MGPAGGAWRGAAVALAALAGAGAGAGAEAGAGGGAPPAVCARDPGVPGWPDYPRGGKEAGPAGDLTFCKDWSARTCCGKAQTDHIRGQLYHLLQVENTDCRDLWATVGCSVCDPEWGSIPPPKLCLGLANRLYAACKDEYFIGDDKTSLLAPCRERDAVCVRLGDWADGGATMAGLMGFRVDDSALSTDCYSGAGPRRTAQGADRKGKGKGSGRGRGRGKEKEKEKGKDETASKEESYKPKPEVVAVTVAAGLGVMVVLYLVQNQVKRYREEHRRVQAIKDILEKRKQQVEQRKKLQAQYDATNATPE